MFSFNEYIYTYSGSRDTTTTETTPGDVNFTISMFYLRNIYASYDSIIRIKNNLKNIDYQRNHHWTKPRSASKACTATQATVPNSSGPWPGPATSPGWRRGYVGNIHNMSPRTPHFKGKAKAGQTQQAPNDKPTHLHELLELHNNSITSEVSWVLFLPTMQPRNRSRNRYVPL